MNTIILLVIVIAAVVISKIWAERGAKSIVPARKFLHITAITVSAFSVYIADYKVLISAVAIALPIVFYLVWKGFFKSEDQPRNNWGIFYFALVFLILLWIFPHQPDFIFFPLIILSLADGFAALAGFYFGKHWFYFGAESKSIEGSTAFLFFTFACLYVLPEFIRFAERPFASIYSVIIISIFLTLVEAVSIKGRDNLWVPFGVLYWLLLDTHFIGLSEFIFFIGLGAIMFIVYKLKWLSGSGAIAAALVGWILIISPDPVWIIPAVAFLVVGTGISKLPKKSNTAREKGRNANQVFSNGGIYMIFLGLYFISNQMVFLVCGFASLTAAMSDTASSEIGSRFGSRTVNIVNGRKVSPGLSGGISLVGSLAGLLFAAIFALIPFIIFGSFDSVVYSILLVAGLFGNIMDSIIGSLFQVKYRENQHMPWSDRNPGIPSAEKRGYSAVTNDVVNLLATLLAAVFGGIIYIFL